MTDGICFFLFPFQRICNPLALSWGFAIPIVTPSPPCPYNSSHPPK
jgi:hypothetical protein